MSTLTHIRTALEIAQTVAQAIPALGGVVGAALELALKVTRLAEGAKVLRDDCRALAERASRITLAVVDVVKDADPGRATSLEDRIVSLIRTLEECRRATEEAVTTKWLRRVLTLRKLQSSLAACQTQLEEAVMVFGIQAHITHSFAIDEIKTVTLRAAQDVSEIKQVVCNSDGFDGEFRFFRLCDFEILKTLPSARGADSSAQECHLVRLYGSQEQYLVKKYDRRQTTTRHIIDSLKRIQHANLEQLVGYSRPDSPTPFYIVSSGTELARDIALSSGSQGYIKLLIDSMPQMISIIDLISNKIFSEAIIWFNALHMDIAVDCKISKGRNMMHLSPRLTPRGKLVIDFPDPKHISQCLPHDLSLFPGRDGGVVFGGDFCPYLLDRVSKQARCCSQSYVAPWLRFMDDWRIFRNSIIEPQFLPAKEEFYSPLFSLTHGYFRPIIITEEQDHFPIDIPCKTVHCRCSEEERTEKIITWTRDHSGFLRYMKFSSIDHFGWLECVWHRDWTTPRINTSVWQSFARNIYSFAEHAGMHPSTLCYAIGFDDKLAYNFDFDHSTPKTTPSLWETPQTLFFFEYPTDIIGPPHLIPGYWAIDAAGEHTSSITSYSLHDASWRVECQLDGVAFHFRRTASVKYAQFTEAELDMIQETAEVSSGRIEETNAA